VRKRDWTADATCRKLQRESAIIDDVPRAVASAHH
jgi:hypothetical protein